MRVAPVDLPGRLEIRTRRPLFTRFFRTEVVPGGEHRTRPAQDDDAHLVVRLGLQEGVVELDEETPVLRVAGIGPVEHDARDAPRIERLVEHVLVVSHLVLPWAVINSSAASTLLCEGTRRQRVS